MTRKHNKQIAGGIQALIIMGAIVTIIGAVSGCASTDSDLAARDANDLAQYWAQASTNCHATQSMADSDTCTAVIQMLQTASQTAVVLTSDEIEQLAKEDPDDGTDWVEETTHRCNDATFVDHTGGVVWGDAARSCGFVAKWGSETLGVKSVKVELAYQRACALPRAQGLNHVATEMGIDDEYGNYCAMLGDFYRQTGKVQRALAIYQYAPNCHASRFDPAYPELFDTACPLAADEILEANAINSLKRCTQSGQGCSVSDVERAKKSYAKVEADFHRLCTRQFSGGLPPVCDAHLNEQEQAAAERYWARASELAHERSEQEYEQRQVNERAHDAEVNALVNAIRSLPSGEDPSAIVDSANRQAAKMNAFGGGNDAASQQAAEQRREQAAAQQLEGSAQQPEAQAGSVTTSDSGLNASNTSSSDTPTYRYTQPATDCLSYAADPDTQGILVTNNCKDQILLTWARPSGTKVGLDHAIQGGPDIVPAGGTDSIPPHPVRVFACHDPGMPSKPGQENSSSGWQLEYTDTSFTCPALNHAAKTQQ